MRWLTNTYDPKEKDARRYVVREQGQTINEAQKWHQQYLADKHIGPPKATAHYTSAELSAMRIVGVYAKDDQQAHVLALAGLMAKDYN